MSNEMKSEDDISEEKAALLGRYLMSLPDTMRPHAGQRLKVLCRFVEGPYELSRSGYKGFVADNGCDLLPAHRTHLCDFLAFCGIKIGLRTGKKRGGRVVERLDVVSAANRKRVTAFLEWCEKQREYSDATLRIKKSHMMIFFRYFNEFNLENCRNFIATREHEGKHPKSLNMYMITLRHYGEFVKRPVALKRITIARSLSTENVPTKREYDRFLEWLRKNGKWSLYWSVRVLGCTGMRRSELEQVTWQDILEGEVYPRCKGKKHRMVFFPKRLVADVEAWLRGRDTDLTKPLMWSKRYDRPYSSRGFDMVMKDAALKAGYPKEKAHCHAFRHFFAKQFLAKTKDVVQLAELLGHESVDTTRLYLQKSKSEQANDVNKIVDW